VYRAVHLFYRLQGESPENGSFLGFGWRLSGVLGAKRLNTSLWRLSAMKKARIWRAFLVKQRKFSENKNAWLAAQCRSHPSPRKFPANREFYRENRYFGAPGDDLGARSRCAAATSREIPYSD
jgi:hypothetical protein